MQNSPISMHTSPNMPDPFALPNLHEYGPTAPPVPYDEVAKKQDQFPKISIAKEAVWTTDKEDEEPRGYRSRKDGLWHIEPKADGEDVETWLCSPISILGKTRDTQSESWGLFLSWHDDDGINHQWAMPKTLLVSRDNAWIAALVDKGLRVSTYSKARSFLNDYLMMHNSKVRILCTDSIGWHGQSYVLPDTTLSKNADTQERVVLQSISPQNPYTMKGELSSWQETIGAWARGNSRLMFAISASLSGLLLDPLGMENGGFNFVGGSSTGKTTALCVAASVFGKGTGQGGYIRTWRSTDNGLEGISCLHNDACLCLDELGQAPPRVTQNAVYMLGNGQGKSRAKQDGAARAGRTWRIVILSTGEKAIAEKIAEDGGKVQAGQEVRLVDIPADAEQGLGIFEDLHGAENPRVFADALKAAATKDYGHVNRAFIEQVQAYWNDGDIEVLKNTLAQHLHLICDNADADGQVQRVAKRFLLVAITGETAAEWGILPWAQGEALQAAKTCFEAWLIQRGGNGAHEDKAIFEQVMLFIENHGQSRFQDIDNPDALCVNRVGYRRHTDYGTEYCILPESFKAEICKGLNASRAAKVLDKTGLLVRDSDKHMTKQVYTPDQKRKRCYVIVLRGEACVGENSVQVH